MSSHPPQAAARTLDTMGRRRSLARRALGAVLAVGLIAVLPAAVLAHPLGNFTINHYAGIRVEPDRILLDLVIDQAEIPTFQARFDFDLDGDASLSDEEIDAGRITACDGLASSLALSAGGSSLTPRLTAAGLSFPLGVGGLSTMREVCSFEAPLPTTIDGSRHGHHVRGSVVRRADRMARDRGAGFGRDAQRRRRRASADERVATIDAVPAGSIASPLRDRSLALRATVGGATLAPLEIPDASPVAVVDPAPAGNCSLTRCGGGSVTSVRGHAGSGRGRRPGRRRGHGPAGHLPPDQPDPGRGTPVTPRRGALGAGHALTPGHGKTLMAAYLVGTRGSARHAIGLGAAVSVSHTVGILALAAVVLAATDVVAPDAMVRGAPLVAASLHRASSADGCSWRVGAADGRRRDGLRPWPPPRP